MSRLSDFKSGGRPKSQQRISATNQQVNVTRYPIAAINPATSYLFASNGLEAYISSATQVSASARASGSGTVSGTVVVIDDGNRVKSVQRGTTSGTASIPISTVDPSKCILICNTIMAATITANAINFAGAVGAGQRWELVEFK